MCLNETSKLLGDIGKFTEVQPLHDGLIWLIGAFPE
jgi:hypothetical protein